MGPSRPRHGTGPALSPPLGLSVPILRGGPSRLCGWSYGWCTRALPPATSPLTLEGPVSGVGCRWVPLLSCPSSLPVYSCCSLLSSPQSHYDHHGNQAVFVPTGWQNLTQDCRGRSTSCRFLAQDLPEDISCPSLQKEAKGQLVAWVPNSRCSPEHPHFQGAPHSAVPVPCSCPSPRSSVSQDERGTAWMRVCPSVETDRQ